VNSVAPSKWRFSDVAPFVLRIVTRLREHGELVALVHSLVSLGVSVWSLGNSKEGNRIAAESRDAARSAVEKAENANEIAQSANDISRGVVRDYPQIGLELREDGPLSIQKEEAIYRMNINVVMTPQALGQDLPVQTPGNHDDRRILTVEFIPRVIKSQEILSILAK
jgi:hypothetical protein